jgi:hypothetical protein
VSRQHLEQCRFSALQQFDRGSSAWTLAHRAGLNERRLRFGDRIKFWPLVFSHGEKNYVTERELVCPLVDTATPAGCHFAR